MCATVNQNSTKFLDFARSPGLSVARSWFQCPEAHRWTWCSNTGVVAKESDHVLIDGHWRMIQNCRVYQSAQFLNTDQRLVVATLKLQLTSGRMVPSQPRLDVGKLKDEKVAEEFANRPNGDLGVLGGLGNPEELWSEFKTTVLDVAGGCLQTHRRTKKNFVSQGTRHWIPLISRRARLNGRVELFNEWRHKTVHVLRVDKEVYVRGICEGVEQHMWSSDPPLFYKGICALHSSKLVPWCTAVGAEGGGLLTEESEGKGLLGRLL